MRVFISYTAEDLADHAGVVADVVRRLEWVALDHRDWGASGQPSASECKRRVLSCDMLVVLVAHRYGWVPSKDEGGDNITSITRLEVSWARASAIPVLPYLINPEASWPVRFIEGLQDRTTLERLEAFKAYLRQYISGFFGPDPASLEKTLALDLIRAEQRIKSARQRTPELPQDKDEALVPLSLYDPLNPPTVVERVRARLPKRILSIDDGLVGAFIALEVLEEIERRLQVRYGEAGFVLSDYFDLIGGVGTGAAIATSLALGQTVASTKEAYGRISKATMSKKSLLFNRFRYQYDPDPLKQALRSLYGDSDLRSPRFKTCVILVATRLDLGRVVHFTNFPNEPHGEYGTLRLSDILYGCLSFPTYLPPLELPLSPDEKALVQNGSFSVGQNPSLYLFLVATSTAFDLRWRTGERWLQIFSIGTGESKAGKLFKDAADVNLLTLVNKLTGIQIEGANELNRLLLEKVASTEAPDGEPERVPFSRQRYEVRLNADNIVALGLNNLSDIENLMTKPLEERLQSSDVFSRIGRHAANQIRDSDFLRTFDVRRPVNVAVDAVSVASSDKSTSENERGTA
jgi:hypothetical protein